MKGRSQYKSSSRKTFSMPYVMGITGLGIVAYAVSRFARSFSSKNMSSKNKDYDRSDFSTSGVNRNQKNNLRNQDRNIPSGLSASRNTGAGMSENNISGI